MTVGLFLSIWFTVGFGIYLVSRFWIIEYVYIKDYGDTFFNISKEDKGFYKCIVYELLIFLFCVILSFILLLNINNDIKR